tara:strand:- start:122 stop:334 length:213 start_codon:yes stop_codon:yes gene_type:complete
MIKRRSIILYITRYLLVEYIYCSSVSVSVSPVEVPCLENSTAAYIVMAITEAVNRKIGPEFPKFRALIIL